MRYLIFDGGCSVCSKLASSLKDASSKSMEIISISEPKAISWLDKKFPQGWKHAPYLIIASDDQIQAWSGLSLILELLKLTGLKGILLFWNMTRRKSAFSSALKSRTRRQLLKTSLGVGIAAVLSKRLWGSEVELAHAQSGNCPCFFCTGECYIVSENHGCRCFSDCPNSCNPGCPSDYVYEYICYCDECGSYSPCTDTYCDLLCDDMCA